MTKKVEVVNIPKKGEGEIRKSIIFKLNPTRKQRIKLLKLIVKNKDLLNHIKNKIDDYEKIFIDVYGKCNECEEETYLEYVHDGKLVCDHCLFRLHKCRPWDIQKEMRPKLKSLVEMPNTNYYDEQVGRVFSAHKSFLQLLSSPKSKNPQKPKFFNHEVMELGKVEFTHDVSTDQYFSKLNISNGLELIHIRKGDKKKPEKRRQEKFLKIWMKKYASKEVDVDEKTLKKLKIWVSDKTKYKKNLNKWKESIGMKGGVSITKKNIVKIKATPQRAKLVKKNDEFYLYYPFIKSLNIPIPDETFNFIGYDKNPKDLLVSSNGMFFKNRFLAKMLHMERIRGEFSKRGQKRKVKNTKGKISNITEYLSKVIASMVIISALRYEKPCIVRENLTGINEDVILYRGDGKKVKSKKAKAQNKLISGWFYRKIDFYIECLATWWDIPIIEIECLYTSKMCNRCKHINYGNRIDATHFKCKNCGYEVNAQFNASFNIRDYGILKVINLTMYNRFVESLKKFRESKKRSFDASKFFKHPKFMLRGIKPARGLEQAIPVEAK